MKQLLIPTFSAHQFSNKGNIPFSIEDYSKMKHGDKAVARNFARELAVKFFYEHSQLILDNQLLIMGSAYSFVRCAASVITDNFVDRINELIVHYGGSRCEKTTINRSLPYISDYGKLDREGRAELLKSDQFSFDSDFAQGKLLIFIDDVIITGSHQVKIEEMLDRYKIPYDHAFCLYFAQFIDDGETHPDIESYLNEAYVTGLAQLAEIFMGEHEIVVRQLKMMLSWDNPHEFLYFLSRLPNSTIRKIYYQVIGENYHTKANYMHNFYILREQFLKIEADDTTVARISSTLR